MKKNSISTNTQLSTVVFSVAGVVLVNVAKASLYLPTITIGSDGSIEPETDFIEQSGNVYSLTADISRAVSVGMLVYFKKRKVGFA